MGYAIVFVGALLAFALSAISGGGAGLLLIPLIGLVIPAMQVPAALSIGTATSAVSRAIVFRRAIRWDVVRWFVPAAVPATGIGAWLLSLAQPVWVEFLLGLFLLANIVFLFRKDRGSPDTALLAKPMLLAVGAAAGLLSGFTGAVGVVFNRIYLRCGLSKEEVVATRGANECLLHLIKIGLYAAFGLLGLQALAVGALIAVAAILSSFAARPLIGLVSEPIFRRLNHGAMAVAGVAMLATAGSALAARYEISLSTHVRGGQLEARLVRAGRAVAVEWKLGQFPQIERTIDLAQVPDDVREEAEDIREAGGTGPVRIDEVHSLQGLSYEIHIGTVTRRLVVTD